MGQQGAAILNLTGGLNLVDPHYAIQQQPGSAKELINFEPSIEAGYRRINGFTKYGTAQPSGSSGRILGIIPYADGVLVAQGTGIYFSTDGDTWLQVNRDTYTAQTGTVAVTDSGSGYIDVTGSGTSFTTEYAVGDMVRIDSQIRQIASITSDTVMTLESALSGAVSAGEAHYKNGDTSLSGSVLTRTSQGRTKFTYYPNDGEYGSVAFTDTSLNNNIGWFKITGSGVSRTYYYDHLTVDDFAAPATAKFCTTFKERLVVANSTDEAGTVYYSERYSNQRFDGAGSGSIEIEGQINFIMPFKDKLIIFTRTGIYQLVNIDDATNIAVLPITTRTGCVAGCSVQELGGDIIFLSHDGVRMLRATDAYGDVSLGVISRKIDPIIKDIVSLAGSYDISSTVLREKNQYRLFYTDSAADDSAQRGIVGTLKRGASGELEWEWAELHGFPVSCIHSVVETCSCSDEGERVYHGGYDGFVYRHDNGNSFAGTDIPAVVQLHEYDYGNRGQRKTLHYVTISGTIEGATDTFNMQITYDHDSSSTAQPAPYTIVGFDGVSVYGSAVYDTDTYGGILTFDDRILVEGSGYSNAFRFSSVGAGSPFSIDGIYVDLRAGGMW